LKKVGEEPKKNREGREVAIINVLADERLGRGGEGGGKADNKKAWSSLLFLFYGVIF
jgi:hypothetical protein